MATVRIFHPKNRLQPTLGGPGDPTIEQLTERAKKNVAKVGDQLREFVRGHMVTIQGIGASAEEEVFARSRALMASALAVAEVAGAYGESALSEAARGVIIMVDALATHGIWHSEALRLHLDALARLSSDPPPSEAEAKGVLQMLAALRRNIGVVADTAIWEPPADLEP